MYSATLYGFIHRSRCDRIKSAKLRACSPASPPACPPTGLHPLQNGKLNVHLVSDENKLYQEENRPSGWMCPQFSTTGLPHVQPELSDFQPVLGSIQWEWGCARPLQSWMLLEEVAGCCLQNGKRVSDLGQYSMRVDGVDEVNEQVGLPVQRV